jgi:hypothetical protein
LKLEASNINNCLARVGRQVAFKNAIKKPSEALKAGNGIQKPCLHFHYTLFSCHKLHVENYNFKSFQMGRKINKFIKMMHKNRLVQANYFQKHHFTADIPFFEQSGLLTGATLGMVIQGMEI